MKTKTTFERLFEFARAADGWLARDKANERTKLGYAISRMTARVKKAQERYLAAVEDINIDACATDDKGIILRDSRGDFTYTRDGLKQRNKLRQELYESEIEVEPYFATQLPDDLTEAEREAFEGFVVREEMAAEAVS